MTIGDNIRRFRKREGLTQQQLGDKLGVSQSAIGQFEKGTSLKIETIQKIATALKISVTALLAGTDINYNEVSKTKDTDTKNVMKRLALIKFLDCIYSDAYITKIKKYDPDTNEDIYVHEYVSIGTDMYSCGEIAIDDETVETLINILENTCKQIISLKGEHGASYEGDFINKNNHYHILKETLQITTEVKNKYKKISRDEIEAYKEMILNNSNKEEFLIEEPIIYKKSQKPQDSEPENED